MSGHIWSLYLIALSKWWPSIYKLPVNRRKTSTICQSIDLLRQGKKICVSKLKLLLSTCEFHCLARGPLCFVLVPTSAWLDTTTDSITMKLFPHLWSVHGSYLGFRHLRNLGLVGEDGSYFKIGVGVAFLSVVAFGLFRYVRQQKV